MAWFCSLLRELNFRFARCDCISCSDGDQYNLQVTRPMMYASGKGRNNVICVLRYLYTHAQQLEKAFGCVCECFHSYTRKHELFCGRSSKVMLICGLSQITMCVLCTCVVRQSVAIFLWRSSANWGVWNVLIHYVYCFWSKYQEYGWMFGRVDRASGLNKQALNR